MKTSFAIPQLKILLLEDNNSDAEIIIRLLKKEGLDFASCQVMHKKEFLLALDEFKPDIILADYALPNFSAIEALEIVNKRLLHIPFIMVSGTVSEEFAIKILKAGADDYILKDRMARLPTAIYSALEIGKTKKEIEDYKFALDQSAIISIADKKGKITYVNENFCRISKYSKNELLGQDHRILKSAYHSKEFINQLWTTITCGEIWRGEFCNKAKDGSIYWVDATIVPFLDDKGKPIQYLAIRNEITAKKMLEKEIWNQKIEEHKKITRAVLKAAEKERDFLGKELHDNINQILVGATLHLGIATYKDHKLKDLIKYPVELIDQSIKEIRLLSHKMVSPTKDKSLKMQVMELLHAIDHPTLKTNFTCLMDNDVLSVELRLNIYRILQELTSNILKHADASMLDIGIKANEDVINIVVTDNGKGFVVNEKRGGIGLTNIKNRVEAFNGKLDIQSSPANGTIININMPL